MINESLNLEIWDRLIRRESLDDLSLPLKNGRLDLSGLILPHELISRHHRNDKLGVIEIEPSAVFNRANWENLDFSGSRLNSIRFFGCTIQNCCFDHCQLQDLRLWATKITDTSFQGSNLRKSALGGVYNKQRNAYTNVDFTEADLCQTAYTAASFEDSIFNNTKLERIDFQTCTFSNCQFTGELRHVLFYGIAHNGDDYPPNRMRSIDFSRAKLRYVEFRGLDLDDVQLPNNSEHFIIQNYPNVLDHAIVILRSKNDITSRKLIAYLTTLRKWTGKNQIQGIINKQDLCELFGEDGVSRMIELIA